MDTNNVNNNENEEVKNEAIENNDASSSEENGETKNILEMDEEKEEADQA